MKVELVLLLAGNGELMQDAEGVYRPVYNSTYVHTHVRMDDRNGSEWAYVNGDWTLLRTDTTGVRYVVTKGL